MMGLLFFDFFSSVIPNLDHQVSPQSVARGSGGTRAGDCARGMPEARRRYSARAYRARSRPYHGVDPAHVTISRLSQHMQGKSSYQLLAELPHLRKRFWGRHIWARGYCCRSSGKVTDEVIKAYIAQQDQASDDVCRNEGEASSAEDAPSGEAL